MQVLAAVYAVSMAKLGRDEAIRESTKSESEWCLAGSIPACKNALVYSLGYDGTFGALVVRKPEPTSS